VLFKEVHRAGSSECVAIGQVHDYCDIWYLNNFNAIHSLSIASKQIHGNGYESFET
jgi:hypothetical protein